MKTKKKPMFFFPGLMVGAIIGISLWNILLAHRIDDLHKRNMYLESTAENYRSKLEKLEKAQPEKAQTVKDIFVITDLEDEVDRMIIEQAVKEKYKAILGRKTEEIDLDLVIQVVDKRLFKTDKYQYQLHVEKIALSSTLTIWLSVSETS